MPYLIQKRKDDLKDPKTKALGAGDLTYLMTMAMLEPPEESSLGQRLDKAVARYMPKEPRYENYAVVLGCLASTKMEYERRLREKSNPAAIELLDDFATNFYIFVVGPYEDKKIQENGDVYGA